MGNKWEWRQKPEAGSPAEVNFLFLLLPLYFIVIMIRLDLAGAESMKRDFLGYPCSPVLSSAEISNGKIKPATRQNQFWVHHPIGSPEMAPF
jgi:hypothetical protein